MLQQHWPAAFPEAPQQVRPLIAGLTPLIATALDWSHPYTRAVLRTWKLRPAYCRAVLEYPVRFDLDGNPTEQPVGEDARTMAKTRLDTWASKRRQPAPHKPPSGGGTTAPSSTRALDHRNRLILLLPQRQASAGQNRQIENLLSRRSGTGCCASFSCSRRRLAADSARPALDSNGVDTTKPRLLDCQLKRGAEAGESPARSRHCNRYADIAEPRVRPLSLSRSS